MEKHIKVTENHVDITINPEMYPLETVYSTAYVFLDKAYVILDGDKKNCIEVRMIRKDGSKIDLAKLGGEFFNELINYADYQQRSEQTKKFRETLLQRSLITNDPLYIQQTDKNDEFDDLLKELEEDEFDDPEGIAVPWEEKYGDDKKNTTKPTASDTKKDEEVLPWEKED